MVIFDYDCKAVQAWITVVFGDKFNIFAPAYVIIHIFVIRQVLISAGAANIMKQNHFIAKIPPMFGPVLSNHQ